jgi:ubiquinone/menaquinone biosynthesis C-methylase UbiE
MDSRQAAEAVEFHARLSAEWEAKYGRARFQKRKAALERCLAGRMLSGTEWLDAGCGTGTLSRWLAEAGAGVHSVDAAPEMVAIATALNARHAASARLAASQRAVVECLPFPDQRFDGVLCSSVIEYLESPAKCLHEIWRVLRPGGTLLVSAPNRQSLVRQGLKAALALTTAFQHPWPAYLALSRQAYAAGEFAALLRQCGFEVDSVHPLGASFPFFQNSRFGPSLYMFCCEKAASGPQGTVAENL